MARFVSKLRAATAKRKRGEMAAAALTAAAKETDAEVERIRKLRPPHSLLEGKEGCLHTLA